MVTLEEPFKGVIELKNYIDGEWVESTSSDIREIRNPATLETIAKVPIGSREDVKSAVDAATDAFPRWRRTTPLTRARYLFTLKQLLEEHFEELSRTITVEHGKIIDEARGEIRRGIENVETAAGIPSLMMGYNLEDISRGIDEILIKQPLGVFACIAPFNFPFMVPLWYLPYAVATGNTYIVKPSPWTPLSMMKLTELIEEAGFPSGVVNMVQGEVEPVQELLHHPNVKGVSFVGSTKIGRDVIYKEASACGKRVQAQCGAKNFLVVLPDAEPNITISSLMSSFFGNTGQRCLAGANLVFIDEEPQFTEGMMNRIKETAKGIKIGYGLEEGIQMGPCRVDSSGDGPYNHLPIVRYGPGRSRYCWGTMPSSGSVRSPSVSPDPERWFAGPTDQFSTGTDPPLGVFENEHLPLSKSLLEIARLRAGAPVGRALRAATKSLD